LLKRVFEERMHRAWNVLVHNVNSRFSESSPHYDDGWFYVSFSGDRQTDRQTCVHTHARTHTHNQKHKHTLTAHTLYLTTTFLSHTANTWVGKSIALHHGSPLLRRSGKIEREREIDREIERYRER
jgi:hypothetical protein